MIRHAVERHLSMPQHLGGVFSLDSLLEMSQRLIAYSVNRPESPNIVISDL